MLAAVGITDHRTGTVIDLRFLTWCGFDDRARFWSVRSAQLAYEALDALIAAREAATVHQVLVDGHGVAVAPQPQLDGLAIGFAGAGGGTASAWSGCLQS